MRRQAVPCRLRGHGARLGCARRDGAVRRRARAGAARSPRMRPSCSRAGADGKRTDADAGVLEYQRHLQEGRLAVPEVSEVSEVSETTDPKNEATELTERNGEHTGV